MKRKFIMMPVLIQDPKQPGNDIDERGKSFAPFKKNITFVFSFIRAWGRNNFQFNQVFTVVASPVLSSSML
jgi:hypothetical protein